jgi:L-cysteine/cystine lyase
MTFDKAAARQAIPALSRCAYLNTGTFGPLSTPAREKVAEMMAYAEKMGPYTPDCYRTMLSELEQTREVIAETIGAESSDNIALTRSTTEGASIVAWGIDWQRGDRILTSTHEHTGGFRALQLAAERFDAEIDFWDCPDDDDARLLEAFEAKLRAERPRLVMFSYVTSDNGWRVPIAEMVPLAHRYGALFMVDAAHAEGQFAIDVGALECDFLAGCGHKWLGGPQGTGFLYIAPWLTGRLLLTWSGALLVDTAPDKGSIFEMGTRPWYSYSGMRAAIHHQEGMGRAVLEAEAKRNAQWFKERLREMPGVEILTPLEPARSTGLVALKYGAVSVPDLSGYLWDEAKISVAVWGERMRVAVAYYTTRDELELLLDVWGRVRKID